MAKVLNLDTELHICAVVEKKINKTKFENELRKFIKNHFKDLGYVDGVALETKTEYEEYEE